STAEVLPLSEETLSRLDERDVEAITEAFRNALPRMDVLPEGTEPALPAPRSDSETAYQYFDRLMAQVAADAERRNREVMEKFLQGNKNMVGKLAKDMLDAGARVSRTVTPGSAFAAARGGSASGSEVVLEAASPP